MKEKKNYLIFIEISAHLMCAEFAMNMITLIVVISVDLILYAAIVSLGEYVRFAILQKNVICVIHPRITDALIVTFAYVKIIQFVILMKYISATIVKFEYSATLLAEKIN